MMAYGVVDGDFVDVKLVRAIIGEGEYRRAIGLDVRMDITKLFNSLDRLRREQSNQRACSTSNFTDTQTSHS
jgi:hypothetical protein